MINKRINSNKKQNTRLSRTRIFLNIICFGLIFCIIKSNCFLFVHFVYVVGVFKGVGVQTLLSGLDDYVHHLGAVTFIPLGQNLR